MKSDVTYKEDRSSSVRRGNIECCSISVRLGSCTLSIICVYKPSMGDIDQFTEMLSDVLSYVCTRTDYTLLCGDLNID